MKGVCDYVWKSYGFFQQPISGEIGLLKITPRVGTKSDHRTRYLLENDADAWQAIK